jgi:hypothetical protein
MYSILDQILYSILDQILYSILGSFASTGILYIIPRMDADEENYLLDVQHNQSQGWAAFDDEKIQETDIDI